MAGVKQRCCIFSSGAAYLRRASAVASLALLVTPATYGLVWKLFGVLGNTPLAGPELTQGLASRLDSAMRVFAFVRCFVVEEVLQES